MAGFSWSNPDQSDATAAKLQGAYRPEQVQIGSIVAALLKQKPNPTDHDIDEFMQGNICRCGTYQRIRKAIKQAAGVKA